MSTADWIFIVIIVVLIIWPEKSSRLDKKQLTPQERKIFNRLRYLPGNDLTAVGIREICMHGTIENFRKTLRELKEQAIDRKQTLEWLVGSKNAELILNYQEDDL